MRRRRTGVYVNHVMGRECATAESRDEGCCGQSSARVQLSGVMRREKCMQLSGVMGINDVQRRGRSDHLIRVSAIKQMK